MKYTCPVCGYDALRYPPSDYTICPSCGTEFGNTDFEYTHEELREIWVNNNYQWHSRVIARPQNWNPREQLLNVLNPVTVFYRIFIKELPTPRNAVSYNTQYTYTLHMRLIALNNVSDAVTTSAPATAKAVKNLDVNFGKKLPVNFAFAG